jgi:hypothetical protein
MPNTPINKTLGQPNHELALQLGVPTILPQYKILDKRENPITSMHNRIKN